MKLTKEKIINMSFDELGEAVLEEMDSIENRADFLRSRL